MKPNHYAALVLTLLVDALMLGVGSFLIAYRKYHCLCVVEYEIGINAQLGTKSFGKRHGDATAATHYLTEL